MNKIILAIFLIFLTNIVFSETFYPTTINELDLTIKMHGIGKITGLKEGQEVVFQTLTFQETNYQKVNSVQEILYTQNNIYHPEYVLDEYGNKYVKFVIKENGEFNYKITANIKTKSLIHEIEDVNIGRYPESVKIFTERSNLIESSSIEIQTVANNKFPRNSFIEILNQTIFWVNDYVEYASNEEFQKYYLLQKSAIDTLLSKKGVCDEFTNLAAAILRAKNIPTRIIIGPTFDGQEWGNHAWLEVYHEKHGWIPSDPTFREPGFVDGTHIKMGSFTDVTLSQAKAIFPSNASINFQTRTIPEVEINSKEYFLNTQLKSLTQKFQTNKWNDLNIEIKNNTDGFLTIPLKIKSSGSSIPLSLQGTEEIIGELIFDEKTKSIELAAREKGTICFKVYPNLNLDNMPDVKGSILIYSLSEPYQANFEITSGPKENNGSVKVKDVVPVILNDKIRFDIKLLNTFSTEKEVIININENDSVWSEIITPFTLKEIQREFPLNKNYYNLVIDTPTEKYSTIIIVNEQKIIQQEPTKETIIIQKIETDTANSLLRLNPIELIIFAILPIIAFTLLIIFATKKRYV